MTPNRDNLEAWLEQSLRGDLDGMTPEQIAALEAALNASPELAARASGALPPSDRPAAEIALPTSAEWEGVWSRIESAGAPRLRIHAASPEALRDGRREREGGRAAPPRIFRLWTSVSAAVAACIALALVWRGLFAPPEAGASPLWTMSASANVEILELEVYDDAVAAVDFGDSDNGAVVISVYERPPATEGA